jgi:hypothetical protein
VIVDNKEAQLDQNGNFKADTYLKIGENKIAITTMDRRTVWRTDIRRTGGDIRDDTAFRDRSAAGYKVLSRISR